MSKEESNYKKALEKKEALNLTLNQSLALNNIMRDLALQEFEKGLDRGVKIARR